MAAAPGPELEAVVEAVVRAVVARHRAAARLPEADAVVRDVVAVLGPVLRLLTGPGPDTPAADGRVVVERDVLEAAQSGRLVLRRGAVVTPLARDTAVEQGVELVREGS